MFKAIFLIQPEQGVRNNYWGRTQQNTHSVSFSSSASVLDIMQLCMGDSLKGVQQGARQITTVADLDDQARLVRAVKDSLVRYQHRRFVEDASNLADCRDEARFDRSVVPTLKVLSNVLGQMAQKDRPLAEALFGEISTNTWLRQFYPARPEKPVPMSEPTSEDKTFAAKGYGETCGVDKRLDDATHPMSRVFGPWHLLVQIMSGEWAHRLIHRPQK